MNEYMAYQDKQDDLQRDEQRIHDYAKRDVTAAEIEVDRKNSIHANQDFIDGLREMADWIEQTNWHDVFNCTIHVFPEQGKFAEAVRRLGNCKKEFIGAWAYGVKKFGNSLEIRVCADRGKVCERVKVGTRIIPAQPEQEIDVYEWHCPESILKGE